MPYINYLHLYTDAVGSRGVWAVYGRKWFYGSSPTEMNDCNITPKE